MKIVIAAEIYPPDIGGPATYSQNLAGELVSRGHYVSLICYGEAASEDKVSKFSITRITRELPRRKRYSEYRKQLSSLAKNCDMIYAMGPVSSGWNVYKVAKKLHKPFVVKVVGNYAWEQAANMGVTKTLPDTFDDEWRLPFRIWFLKYIQAIVCQKANKIITPSEYLKGLVKNWGVGDDTIEVIYNAVPAMAHTERIPRHPIILAVGRLVTWKGFETLIEVMPEIIETEPQMKLVIVGAGPLERVLEEKIKDMHLEKCVRLTGKLEKNHVATHYQHAMLFVLNSGYEGLPHTVLEAMSFGTPVIVSNIGGNPEVIENEKNGLLFEYNNKAQLREAILKLIRSPKLSRRLAANAHETLQRFKPEIMYDKTIKVLESVV